MTTTVSDNISPEQLRHALTDRLRAAGTIRTAYVDAAFATVPRERFVPGVPLDEAYADAAVYTKHADDGTSLSAASQPTIVAKMLEQLAPRPGHRILEIGAGTGYNAALLGAIAGPSGQVTTIDVDDDLVADARDHLAAAGAANVEAIVGDGVLGHPGGAPYDRVIATVGAYEIPDAWLDQLHPDGRLVVPLRLRGAVSRSIAFERRPGGWHSVGSELAVFMPLRGIGDDARATVAVTRHGDVHVQVHKDQVVDADALAQVLDTPGHPEWSGVHIAPMESCEWMELWLACRLDGALMRMPAAASARDRGIHTMFGWGAMATADGATLAYLTVRPATADGGRSRFEVGVVGHGPAGGDLAARVAAEIRLWDTRHRDRRARFEIPDSPAGPRAGTDADTSRFVLDRHHRPITVIWE